MREDASGGGMMVFYEVALAGHETDVLDINRGTPPMMAESQLENRVLKFACKRNSEPKPIAKHTHKRSAKKDWESNGKVCLILTVPHSSYWYRSKEKTLWAQDLLKRDIILCETDPHFVQLSESGQILGATAGR